MKPENFENRLEQLAWRPAPEQWRREILDAARPRQANIAAGLDSRATAHGWMRLSFPWLAFAGLWVAILLCNSFLLFSGPPKTTSARLASNGPDLPTVWNLQVAELRQA